VVEAKKTIAMKKIAYLLFVVVFPVLANAQIIDSTNAPDVQVRVNREYDEDGNLIRYDSVYTYSYNSNDFSSNEWDSIFNDQFNSDYNEYNLDHFFNRPMRGFPYRFHFDEDFFDRFEFYNDTNYNWEKADSILQHNLDIFRRSMEEFFEQQNNEYENEPGTEI
jgi:hypothetical protein